MEDDIILQNLYEKIFSFYGFHIVDTAKNGAEAVNKYKSFSEKPDIVLMDYRMPIKDGLDASKEILKIDNKAKIIFISADESIKDKVHSLGISDFLHKPFDIEELIQKIKNTLKYD
ncbi:MAG: response regulator [Candidatus Helarchaeota archaeon]